MSFSFPLEGVKGINYQGRMLRNAKVWNVYRGKTIIMNSDYFFSLMSGNMQLLDRFCMEIDIITLNWVETR